MKISILTASYNSGKIIERAIRSVVRQGYPDLEHIVVDGGSEDGTLSILEKYPHLKWISEPDKGQSDAMNKAFGLSSGEVVGYLNADDEYEPGLFERIVSVFENDPSVKMIVGGLYVHDGENKFLAKPSKFLMSILSYWPCRFPLNPISYFYRREVQEKIGKFPVGNHLTMDYWFLLRAYRLYEPVFLDVPFGTFHNYANKSSNIVRVKSSLKRVRDSFLLRYPVIGIKYLKLRYLRKFNS